MVLSILVERPCTVGGRVGKCRSDDRGYLVSIHVAAINLPCADGPGALAKPCLLFPEHLNLPH